MENSTATKATYDFDPNRARTRFNRVVEFMNTHDGKYVTTWEFNFLANLRDNLKLHSDVITERQEETINVIFNRLVEGGHL